MLNSLPSGRESFDPNVRGYHAVYREGEVNHCPGCGRTHWIIGRAVAECAFCTTALPLTDVHGHGQSAKFVSRSWPIEPHYEFATL